MPTDEPLPLHDRLRITLVLYACVMTIYFSAGHVARPPWISLRTPIDDAIPFVPGMRRMMRACLLAYAMAAAFFVVMPVRDADPPLQGASWAERLLDWNRAADVTKNAFPSMHVGLAVLLALIGFRRSPAWGWGLLACAAVISVSTLLVKQHFVADIPAGALVAFAAYRIIYGPGRPQDSA
jgi:membrane-associated phospholipid phosphatase